MKIIFPLIMFFATIVQSASAENFKSEYIHDTYLQKSLTGNVFKPVLVRSFISSENSQSYRIKTGRKWITGKCFTVGAGSLHALLIDIDFDGKSDIWLTGFTDSQGRARCSDVWLYDEHKKNYIYSQDLSAIKNLEISVEEKLIEGGISNCGCAAQCFFHDTYQWVSKKLIKISRREQNCENYKEFSLANGALIQTKEESLDSEKYSNRQNGNSIFIDWSKGTEIDPQH